MLKDINVINELNEVATYLNKIFHFDNENKVFTNCAILESLYLFIKRHTKAHLFQSPLNDNYYFALEQISKLNLRFSDYKNSSEYFKNGICLDEEHRIFSSILFTFEDFELQQRRKEIIEEVYYMTLYHFHNILSGFNNTSIQAIDTYKDYIEFTDINNKIAESEYSFEVNVNILLDRYSQEKVMDSKLLMRAIYNHLLMIVELEHAFIIQKDLRQLIKNASLIRGRDDSLLHYRDNDLTDFLNTHFCQFALKAYHPSGFRSDKFRKIYMLYLKDSEKIAEYV